MQSTSDSSVELDAQIGSATVAPPITLALWALPTIDITETNNKVVVSQNLFLILHPSKKCTVGFLTCGGLIDEAFSCHQATWLGSLRRLGQPTVHRSPHSHCLKASHVSAQPSTFEIRDRPFLRRVGADQLEFELGDTPLALDFDQPDIHIHERILRSSIHSRKSADSPWTHFPTLRTRENEI